MNTFYQKNKIQLNELISRLTSLVTIERIYGIEQIDGDNTRIGLIILISDKRNKVLSELTPIFNVILADYPNYWYRAYFSYMVKDGIKKGNLFFYDTCRPDNLIYSDPASNFILTPKVFVMNGLIDKAKRNFQKEMDKVKAFKEGAIFYFEKGNNPQTAFMVHQQIEISYRAIELFTLGKDKVTHSIRVHQDCVRPHMQDLGNVFNESKADEDKLMRHLDDAYLAVRYEDGFQIRKEKIVLEMEKAEIVYNMVNQIYLDMLNIFVHKHLSKAPDEENKDEEIISPNQLIPEDDLKLINNAEEITTSNQVILEDDLQSIIEKIATHNGAKRIYCFGKRTHEIGRKMLLINNENKHMIHVHFDLLVITEGNIEQELYNLQGDINNNQELPYTVLLLVHNIGHVRKKLADASRFFCRIITRGELVYSESDKSDEWVLVGCPENQGRGKDIDLDKFIINWHNRQWNAKGLIEASMNMTDYETSSVQLFMFNQAVEQICLGLIYSFLDYNPVRKKLNHLFDVCCSFMTFPDEIFPRRTDEDLRLFNALADSFNQIRYKGCTDISDEVITILGKRCENLIEMADNAVNAQLEELKKKLSLNTFDTIRSVEIAE